MDGSHPGVLLGPVHGLLPSLAGRNRIQQHLPHCLASQPDLPGRLEFTHFVDADRLPDPRIQIHCEHFSGIPQTLFRCRLEPVFGGLVSSRRNDTRSAVTGLFCIRRL